MSCAAPAVFLDRDGTIMHEVHYCKDPDAVDLIPGTRSALKLLKSAGYRLVIVTNQSGIGRGLISVPEFEAVQQRLLALLGPELISATYMCPDIPDHKNSRRKPSGAMVLEAARDHQLDLSRSWLIGDKAIDVQCGLNAGVRPILVRTGHGHSADAVGAFFVAKDITSAAEFILEHQPGVAG
jgi:D-glycero-D-manno-heptose 1,7-bisphosphate phosphatase